MNYNVLLIHHDDPDGRMAGYIMKNYFEKAGKTVGTIEASYGMEFNFKKLLPNPLDMEVCIVDFSLNHEGWSKLFDVIPKNKIIWIDHHKSAIEDYKEASELQGIRYLNIAGCELSSIYANGYRQRKDPNQVINATSGVIRNIKEVPIPNGVHMIGDYDCWRKEIPESESLIVGIESLWDIANLTTPEGLEIWEKINDNDEEFINKLVNDGKVIRRYIDARNKDIIESRGFETKIHKFTEHKCIAVNTDSPNSWIFNSVFDKYHLGVCFRYSEKNGRSMTFSVYRLGLEPDKMIDCSKICQSYGGGGHPSASGFATSGTLPFEK